MVTSSIYAWCKVQNCGANSGNVPLRIIAVCAGGYRLFTPRWGSNLMGRFGWWHQNASGSTYGTVRETPPYSKKLWKEAQALHNLPNINALKVFGVS